MHGARYPSLEQYHNWLAWAVILATAVILQLFIALNIRSPFVIPSGDNGSILYIIAYWLKPDVFAQDALLGVAGSTDFYQAALMWPNYLLGLTGAPIGLYFVLICFPIAFAQMAGFFVLGRHLFGNTWPALALALISVPTVYTLAGDLWGLYSTPLFRSAYGAALPWLIYLLISPSRPRPFWLMTAAAAASYLHLPSGPPIAFILLAVSLLRKPQNESIWPAITQHMVAGLLYLVLMAPIAVLFSQNFAAGNSDALDIFRNSAYGSVTVAIDQLTSMRGPERMGILISRVSNLEWARHFVAPVFAGLYIAGGTMLLLMCCIWMGPASIRQKLGLTNKEPWLWISALFVGVVAFAICASALDQAIAYAYNLAPIQIDFIRATRFLVPGAYLGLFFLLAWVLSKAPKLFSIASLLLAAIVWLFAYPSTSQGLYRLSKGQSIEDESLTEFGRFAQSVSTMDDVDLITPVLSYDYLSSALRYIGYKPLTFNRKDNNFISYSGKLDVTVHRSFMDQIDAIRQARQEPETQAAMIDNFTEELGAAIVAIDRRVVLPEAEAILLQQYRFVLKYDGELFALMIRPANGQLQSKQ